MVYVSRLRSHRLSFDRVSRFETFDTGCEFSSVFVSMSDGELITTPDCLPHMTSCVVVFLSVVSMNKSRTVLSVCLKTR